ncbi:MAG TPA: hypothetical protein DCR65_06150 [Gammaproteobacteria bacterium]|jgi:hypothetical protein|nr:hypothetical protein [Gammaproteobacteria bacterium]
MALKTGARLKSAVCDGEVMIVKAPAGDIELTCGGVPMADSAPATRQAALPDHAVGIRIGKRYINEDGSLEVLCVKAGDGGLAVNGQLLLQKDTRQLPKTD